MRHRIIKSGWVNVHININNKTVDVSNHPFSTKEEAERSCYIGYGTNVGCFEIKWYEYEEVEDNTITVESKELISELKLLRDKCASVACHAISEFNNEITPAQMFNLVNSVELNQTNSTKMKKELNNIDFELKYLKEHSTEFSDKMFNLSSYMLNRKKAYIIGNIEIPDDETVSGWWREILNENNETFIIKTTNNEIDELTLKNRIIKEMKYFERTLKNCRGLNDNIKLIYKSQLALAQRLLYPKKNKKQYNE